MGRVILWNTMSSDMPAFGVGVLDRQASAFNGPPEPDVTTPTTQPISPSTTVSNPGISLDGDDLVLPVRQIRQEDFDRGDYVVLIADKHTIRAGSTGAGYVANGLHRVITVTVPIFEGRHPHSKYVYGLRSDSWLLQRGAGHFNFIGEDPAVPVDPLSGQERIVVAWQQWIGIPTAFVCISPFGGIAPDAAGLCQIRENTNNANWLASGSQFSIREIRAVNTARRPVASNTRIQIKLEWQTKRYVVDVEECN